VPFLTPTELDEFWDHFLRGKCSPEMSDRERMWVELMASIGERDAPAMMAAANLLLASGEVATPSQVRYVLGAGMLAAAAQGNDAVARQLWARHGAQSPGDRDLLLRLLISETEAR
jgi:hypothetical protein